MNRMIYTATFFLSIGILLSSCTKDLDLDDVTQFKLNKQEKLKKLNDLYDLAFEDPIKAEADYYQFVQTELLTEDNNFMTDNDVLMNQNFTNLAIRLNKNVDDAKENIGADNLYNLTALKFKTDLISRTLLGEIPHQLKSGDKLTKFSNKIEEATQLFDNSIAKLISQSTVDASIVDKNWYLSKFVLQQVGTIRYYFHNILFDFSLNSDKGMSLNSFFYMPYVPKDELLGATIESTFNKDIVNPPYNYQVQGNKLFFHFHLQNNRDVIYETGLRERHWFFEYEYKLSDGKLILTKPRIGFYMYPELKLVSHDDAAFQAVYPADLQELVLTEK